MYDALFSPYTIGSITLPNRIVMAPHAPFFAEPERPGKRYGEYLAERARNGIGWMVVGLAAGHPHSMPRGRSGGGAWDPAIRPYIDYMLGFVKPHGVVVTTQLSHSGHNALGYESYRPSWSSSQTPSPFNLETPRAVSTADIASIVDYFGRGAGTLAKLGIDGIEIQTSGDYLLGSFISPVMNQRTDEYGGPLENRARIVVDILKRMRADAGPGFLIGIRTSGTRLIRGAPDEDDVLAFCQLVAPYLDFISVMQGSYYDHLSLGPSMRIPRGNAVPHAARIRAATGLPTIVTGRLDDPDLANAIVRDGQADLVGVARGLLSDGAWLRKVQEGRLDDIRPCIGCNHCAARLTQRKEIQCVVNPAYGYESRWGEDTLVPVESPKRVVVVGGGPAGMEAARIAALRGHAVTLYEATGSLGGQIAIAARAPYRADLARMTTFQAKQLAKLDVPVQLNHPVTANDPALAAADLVIVATGSTPKRDGISLYQPGLGSPAGIDRPNVVTSWEALLAPDQLGDSVVVYDEDLTQAGPTVALHLAMAGKIVHIVTTAISLGVPYLELTNELHHFLEDLLHHGVTIHTLSAVRAVDDSSVTIEHVMTDERTVLSATNLVLVTGYRSNDGLLRDLVDAGVNAVGVGDALAPRRLQFAIHDGYLAGWDAEFFQSTQATGEVVMPKEAEAVPAGYEPGA